LADLFVQLTNANVHIGEMAHVFSASDEGPRANRILSEAERGAYENLIILCPKCHTIIDKAEQEYPGSLLLTWKREHKRRIGVLIVYENDADAVTLRRGLANLSHFFPLHVLFLRKDEEGDLHFIREEKPLRIFPS
jgi:hypothetical protein